MQIEHMVIFTIFAAFIALEIAFTQFFSIAGQLIWPLPRIKVSEK